MRSPLALLVAAALVSGPVFRWGPGPTGCRGSEAAATPCNEDPFQCGAGETCWPQQCTCSSGQACDTTNCTPQFQCVGAADRRPGDSCKLQIGSPACGALQTCVAIAGSGVGGACRFYCSPGAPDPGCATGFTCVRLGVGNSSATEDVCLPAPSDSDAALPVGAPDGGGYDPDGALAPPDAAADSGQRLM
jgi:hypothetical protein